MAKRQVKTTQLLFRAGISIVAALILGIGGLFLYFGFVCEGPNCPASSSFGVLLAYVFSWPIFLMQDLFVGPVSWGTNFDPIIFDRFGWLALWVWY